MVLGELGKQNLSPEIDISSLVRGAVACLGDKLSGLREFKLGLERNILTKALLMALCASIVLTTGCIAPTAGVGGIPQEQTTMSAEQYSIAPYTYNVRFNGVEETACTALASRIRELNVVTTAEHCLPEEQLDYVVLSQPHIAGTEFVSIPVEYVRTFNNRDIASIVVTLPPDFSFGPVEFVPEHEPPPEEAHMITLPLGNVIPIEGVPLPPSRDQFREGPEGESGFSRLNGTSYFLDTSLGKGGASGTPVFDKKGRVIGFAILIHTAPDGNEYLVITKAIDFGLNLETQP